MNDNRSSKQHCGWTPREQDQLSNDCERFRAALREITGTCGKVCANYENCTHQICQSSYGAWAIADKALREST